MQYIICILEYLYYIWSVENVKLKLARVERGWSQQDLADHIGVTRQTIGLIEKGNYNPTLKLCISIARALNKTLNELFWEE
jgi:putative transcriptional regulator